MYRGLPTTNLPMRHALAGAAVAGALFMVGRYGISLYVATTASQSALGAASSFAALLVWVYWSSQIFLLGAALAVEMGQRGALLTRGPASTGLARSAAVKSISCNQRAATLFTDSRATYFACSTFTSLTVPIRTMRVLKLFISQIGKLTRRLRGGEQALESGLGHFSNLQNSSKKVSMAKSRMPTPNKELGLHQQAQLHVLG